MLNVPVEFHGHEFAFMRTYLTEYSQRGGVVQYYNARGVSGERQKRFVLPGEGQYASGIGYGGEHLQTGDGGEVVDVEMVCEACDQPHFIHTDGQH